MSIALTNLDDRRWADLVDEGKSLIPYYSPDWTDHNVHDPGITLIELFAWLAEMDIYQINRIPDRHLRKFLSLVGIHPNPPEPAVSALTFASTQIPANQSLRIPRLVEFDSGNAFPEITRFQTSRTTHVVSAKLKAVQFKDSAGFHHLTERWQRGETIEPFGADPSVASEFYLGFSDPLPTRIPVSLLFISEDLDHGRLTRRHILKEGQLAASRCDEDRLQGCKSDEKQARKQRPPNRLEHHSVRLAWEFSVEDGQWQLLRTSDQGRGGVIDYTRSLTLSGRILFTLTAPMHPATIGKVKEPLYYLRCRIVRGRYDAAPALRNCSVNGVFVKQTSAVGVLQWTISRNAEIKGRPPVPGRGCWVRPRFNNRKQITSLTFGKSAAATLISLLKFRANQAGQPGVLQIEAASLGRGDGRPNLRLKLPEAPVLQPGLEIFTLEEGRLRGWSYQRDFDASGRADAHFSLDPVEGLVIFGDGERGRVVPKNVHVFASYKSTRASEGNLPPNTITNLSDTPHNRAILGKSFDKLKSGLTQISNPLPSAGGADTETLAHAIGRAIESVDKTDRAVTLTDYETLAKSTPGTRLARVSAHANVHPGFPCLTAQGIISVMVLPYLPEGRPVPGVELKRAIAGYLFPRRIIGSRVEVIGPVYKELIVRAKVTAVSGANKPEVARRVVASLNRFFHPLTGGPDGTGWPFGRDVFRSEVLQVVDETDGVDHVNSLDLATKCGEPQCGNICLAANELIAAGQHEIEIL